MPDSDRDLSSALKNRLSWRSSRYLEAIKQSVAGIRREAASRNMHEDALRQYSDFFAQAIPAGIPSLIEEVEKHFLLHKNEPLDLKAIRNQIVKCADNWLEYANEQYEVTCDRLNMRELIPAIDRKESLIRGAILEELEIGAADLEARIRLTWSNAAPPNPLSRQAGEQQPAQNVFRLEGDRVRVTFSEQDVFIENTLGAKYLQILLSNAHKSYSTFDLYRMINHPIKASCQFLETIADLAEDGATSHAILDATAQREYRERLNAIREERKKAEQNSDLGTIDALDREVEDIKKELNRNITPLGRPRRFRDETEKTRPSVTKAMKRTMNKFRLHHQQLYSHLIKSGFKSLGGTLCYTPRDTVRWIIS